MRFHSLIIVAAISALAASASSTQQTALPDVDDVVGRMLARDAQRQVSHNGYEGMRRYVLTNDHMHKRAEMTVRVNGDPDGAKHFEVVAEEGWKAAQKHVLRKMLESEAETSRPEQRTKSLLTTDNYEFQLTGTESVGERIAYAIDVTPKRKEKYLFRGRIWVDAEDYALVRADGNPAKNPSFWTKSVHFVHKYEKSGEFWFPVTTESETEARIFGATNLTIEYFEYKPNGPVHIPGNVVEVVQRRGQL
jgi:hypothetical protein